MLPEADVIVTEISIKEKNISDLVSGFVIYEDIEKSTMSGFLSVDDSRNMLDIMNIEGNEEVYISFHSHEKPTKPGHSFKRTFIVYKLENLQSTDKNDFSYRLHFVSKETLTNSAMRCKNTFGTLEKQMETSDIVNTILTKMLDVSEDKINIHSTTKTHNIIFPNYKPFDAIRYLSSIDKAGSSPSLRDKSSSFLFFENKKGFNFVTLNALIEDKLYEKSDTLLNNITFPMAINEKQKSNKEKTSIINKAYDYEITEGFDTLGSIASGMFSNTTYHVNMKNKSFKKTHYDYSSDFTEQSHLQSNDKKKKLTDRTAQENESTFIINSKFSNDDDFVGKNISKQAQLEQYKLLLTIPGNTAWMLGQLIDVVLPSPRVEKNKMIPNKNISGKFLASKIVHTLHQTAKGWAYVQNLELRKGVLNKS